MEFIGVQRGTYDGFLSLVRIYFYRDETENIRDSSIARRETKNEPLIPCHYERKVQSKKITNSMLEKINLQNTLTISSN